MEKSVEQGCGCSGDTRRAEQDPAYRRALWLVILLNLGFGLVELVGGFIADSHALKADSLDFLGDGSISFVVLLALAWGARARALAALTPVLVLGALGLGVIGFAGYGRACVWVSERQEGLFSVLVVY